MNFYEKRAMAAKHALKFKGGNMTSSGRELLRKDIARSEQLATEWSGKPKLSYRKRRGLTRSR